MSTANNASNTATEIGEDAWYARRKRWTTAVVNGDNLERSTVQSQQTQISQFSDEQKLHIYRSLITERRAFKQPIPLGVVTDIVVHGWKQNGTWPEKEGVIEEN